MKILLDADNWPVDIGQRQLWKRALATLGSRPNAAYSDFTSDVIILRDAHRTYGVYNIASGMLSEPTDKDRTASELEERAGNASSPMDTDRQRAESVFNATIETEVRRDTDADNGDTQAMASLQAENALIARFADEVEQVQRGMLTPAYRIALKVAVTLAQRATGTTMAGILLLTSALDDEHIANEADWTEAA